MPTPLKSTTGRSLLKAALLLLLFILSLFSLAATAFADLYFNKGVTYDTNHPAIPYTQAGDLGTNPLGVNTFLNLEDTANIDRILDLVKAGGYGYIRQLFPWKDIQELKGSYNDRDGQNGWAKYDAIVEKASTRGIKIIARLDQPPVWAREQILKTIPPSLDVTGPPDDLNDWGNFVEAAVTRYKGKIKYFQIWNEPNLEVEWNAKRVNPAGYVDLLKVAYERAKAANPEVVIITAALAPSNQDGAEFNSLNDLKYLDQFYEAGGAKYFDILAAQAYGLGYSPDYRFTEPDFREKDLKRVNFSRLADMRAVMLKHDDGKRPVWITEYGWLSMPDKVAQQYPLKPWGENIDEATQAQYLVEGIARARKEWDWVGVVNVWFLKADKYLLDRSDLWGQARYFALVNPDWSVRPAYTALQNYALTNYSIATTGFHAHNSPAITLENQRLKFRFQGQQLDLAGLKVSQETEISYSIDGKTPQTIKLSPQTERLKLAEDLSYGLHTLEMTLPAEQLASYGFYVSNDNAWGWLFLPLYLLGGLTTLGSGSVLGWRTFRAMEKGLPLFWLWLLRQLRSAWQNRYSLSPYGMIFALLLFYFAPPAPLAIFGALLLFPLALVRPDWMIYLAIFTAPLYLNPRNLRESLDPFTRLKNLVVPRDPNNLPQNPLEFSLFEVIIVIAVFAWLASTLYQIWRTRTITFPTNWLTWWRRQGVFALPLLLFGLAATLSLLTPDPSHLREALRDFRVVIVEPLILYLLTVRFIRKREQFLRIFDVLVLASLLIAAGAFYQFLLSKDNTVSAEGVSRVISIYSHPDNLGLYIGRIIPLVTAVAFFGGAIKELPRRRVLYGVALLPLLGTLLLSFSRGAWLASALALLVMIIIARSRRGLIIFGIGALGLVASIPFIKLERITSLFSFVTGSNNTRLHVWQASFDMIRDHPLTGIGLDQFLYKYQLEYVRPEAWLERFTSHPHDILLDYWLRLGIIGPALIIWLLVVFFRTAWSPIFKSLNTPDAKVRQVLVLGLSGSMVDFVAHGLVDNSYFLVDLAAMFCLSFGLLEAMRRVSLRKDNDN